MHALALVTAAHPYLSGLGIWIGCSVIAAGLWALCKQRDDEDVYERRSPDGDGLDEPNAEAAGEPRTALSGTACSRPVVRGFAGERAAFRSRSDDTAGTAKGGNGGSLNGPSRLGASRASDTGGEITAAAGSEPADAHTNTRRTNRPPAAPGLLSERRHVS